MFSGARLEQRKVARDGRLDKGGPCKVAKDRGGGEGFKEGENAGSAK